MIYYGSKISDNILITPEGYLVCKNVPIARTGVQEYYANEIGIKGLTGDTIVKVNRDSREVFDKATMASFEGKPFLDEHSSMPVDIKDVKVKMKGIVQNVHRGSSLGDSYLYADIICYDERVIDKIMNGGKREVSCGYECAYVENSDGTYSQVEIRGNHVALVDQGRAGERVAIIDNKPKTGGKKMAKKKESVFAKVLRPFVNDEASIEDVVEIIEDLIEVNEAKDSEEVVEVKTSDEELDKIEKLERIINDMSLKLDELTVSKTADTDLEELERIEEVLKAEGFDDEDVIIEDEDMDDEDVSDHGFEEIENIAEEVAEEVVEEELMFAGDRKMVRNIVKDMKPLIAKLPQEQRKAFVEVLSKNTIKKSKTNDGYKKIVKARTANSKMAKDNKSQDPRALGKEIMATYNAQANKEVK